MNRNELSITNEQFEKLIKLPAVQNGYKYTIKDNSTLIGDTVVIKNYARWLDWAGIRFVVEDGN